MIAFVGALCFVGWLIWRLHSRFFPRAFFALGQGTDRYKFDDNIRWVVIIGLPLAVFASLVATFLAGSAR